MSLTHFIYKTPHLFFHSQNSVLNQKTYVPFMIAKVQLTSGSKATASYYKTYSFFLNFFFKPFNNIVILYSDAVNTGVGGKDIYFFFMT